MGSSLNMLPFRRFSYPCGQPFYNCPYVTPAYLQPALIDGYCERGCFPRLVGWQLPQLAQRHQNPSCWYARCRCRTLVSREAHGVIQVSLSVRAGALLAAAPRALMAPTGFTRVLQPCRGWALRLNSTLARAVSQPCLFPFCHSHVTVCHGCACGRWCQAQLGRVSSPALGRACPRVLPGSQLGLPLSLAVLPGSALAALGCLCLRALSPVPRGPSSSGQPLGHVQAARLLWNCCTKSSLPLPDREWGESASPFQRSKKEIKPEVLSNPNHSMILPSA